MARALVTFERGQDSTWVPTCVWLATPDGIRAKERPGDPARTSHKLATLNDPILRRDPDATETGTHEDWVDWAVGALGNGYTSWAVEVEPEESLEALYEREIGEVPEQTLAVDAIRVDWIDVFYVPLVLHAGGRLGMTLLPGKRSPAGGRHRRILADDLRWLRDHHRCDVLALLATAPELRQLGIAGIVEATEAMGMRVLVFPAAADAVPEQDAFRDWLDELIDRALHGATVVVASRSGLNRAGLAVACAVRDLGDYSAVDAIELTQITRDGSLRSSVLRDFVSCWQWPRRRAVARALRRRARQKAADDRASFASLSSDGVRLELLRRQLRKVLRGERVSAAYLAAVPSGRPARFVCHLIDPIGHQRLIQKVQSHARRIVEPREFAVMIGPVEAEVPSYRLVPAPPNRLGE